jgi:hypothetical protein
MAFSLLEGYSWLSPILKDGSKVNPGRVIDLQLTKMALCGSALHQGRSSSLQAGMQKTLTG